MVEKKRNDKTNVYVYGLGSFYEHFKSDVETLFDVQGYVDGDTSKNQINNLPIEHSVSEFNISGTIKLLIMVEKPKFIFEIIEVLKESNINENDVILGISLYGVLSKYLTFSLSPEWKVCITCENMAGIADNEETFIGVIKQFTQQIFSKKGNKFKNALRKLYKDELSIMWMDEKLWCANHDADIYYRFEDIGFYNWSYALTFSMIALNFIDNPYVLELGCGDAYWFRKIYKTIDGIKYLGCDIDDDFIKNNKKLCRNINNASFIRCDISKEIPRPEYKEYFDVIIWMESYCVFTDDEHEIIIHDSKDRLGSNGMIFVCDFYSPNRKSPWIYSKNSVSDKEKLINNFKKYYSNVSAYFDEKAEFFILFASDAGLPFKF